MTTENTDTPPAPGKFCSRHWSWLCQAGQGKCQASQNVTAQRYQPHGPTIGVLAEVAAERERQDQKWGEQNHPDIDPRDIDTVARNQYAFRAARWKHINDERSKPTITAGYCHGHPDEPHTHTAWDGVLLEEVYEALAEPDPAKRRAELIQVAAVACAQVEAIDRRTRDGQQ